MPAFRIPDESEYSVTIHAEKIVSEIQDTPEYYEDDSSVIYKTLLENLKPIDFSYYLKRYLYRSAGYEERFEDVSMEDYLTTMADSFSMRGIPVSLTPTSTRPRAAFRNWLTQKAVSREAVMMMGFGLDMRLEDVNAFLTKALQENSLNPKDPVETIFWYCMKNHLGYYHFRRMLSSYATLPGSSDPTKEIELTSTRILRLTVNDIRDEKTLMQYLNQLRRIDGQSRQSVEARAIFLDLYEKARELISDLNNNIEEEQSEVMLDRLKDSLSRNDRLYDEQKQEQVRRFSEKTKTWTKEDITPVNFEEVLFASVPRDRNGNMLPMKRSTLNELFRGKRLNRQHIQEIMDGTGLISRYDLSTMSFFVVAQTVDPDETATGRYRTFIDRTNEILDRCGMGHLYVANPYEAFLMICMLTDYPLGTYVDVWEYSYEQEEG